MEENNVKYCIAFSVSEKEEDLSWLKQSESQVWASDHYTPPALDALYEMQNGSMQGILMNIKPN